jgi:hypothetical protein
LAGSKGTIRIIADRLQMRVPYSLIREVSGFGCCVDSTYESEALHRGHVWVYVSEDSICEFIALVWQEGTTVCELGTFPDRLMLGYRSIATLVKN